MNKPLKWVLSVIVLLVSANAVAGEADVIDVEVQHRGGNSFQIITTVKHDDTGWNHYANAWEVLDMEGNVLAKRTLHHPHVDEQPFTRSLRVTIPTGINQVMIRAVDSVHQTGGKTITVNVLR